MSSAPPSDRTPGWYPDPKDPARERRWDGTSWVGEPHAPPKPGMFGDAYTRAMWTNANPMARRGRFIGILAVILFVLAIVLTFVGLGAVVYNIVSVGLGLFALTAVLSLAALPFVIIGLTRSSRLGGLGTGVSNLVGLILALLLSAGVLVSVGLAVAALSAG
jgi:hypothetical protein